MKFRRIIAGILVVSLVLVNCISVFAEDAADTAETKSNDDMVLITEDYPAESVDNFIANAGELSKEREEFLRNVLSNCGQIMYNEGGMPNSLDKEKNQFGRIFFDQTLQAHVKGLSNMGFLVYLVWPVVGSKPYKSGKGYASIMDAANGKKISESDIQPGDIGFTNSVDNEDNEAAIFLGYTIDGSMIWVILTEESETISVDVFNNKYKEIYSIF